MSKAIRRLSRYISRKIREDVKPWIADKWYSFSHGRCWTTTKKGDDEDSAVEITHQYRDMPIAHWTVQDTISFIRCEVTLGDGREPRICRLCEEREVDGATIQACDQEELTDLGFDQIFRKKLEVKLKAFGKNDEGEDKLLALKAFLSRIGLGSYRERITGELRVYDIRELYSLLSNEQWVTSVGMTTDEENLLRAEVRKFVAEHQGSERARQEELGLLSRRRRKSNSIKMESRKLAERAAIAAARTDLRRATGALREAGQQRDWRKEVDWDRVKAEEERRAKAVEANRVRQAREDFAVTAYATRQREKNLKDTYLPDMKRVAAAVLVK